MYRCRNAVFSGPSSLSDTCFGAYDYYIYVYIVMCIYIYTYVALLMYLPKSGSGSVARSPGHLPSRLMQDLRPELLLFLRKLDKITIMETGRTRPFFRAVCVKNGVK